MSEERRNLQRMRERRKFQRIKVSLSVLDQDTEESIGTIKDISIGGCFVETTILFPKDSTVNIKFILPHELSELSTRGRVASIRENPSGMGIEFYAMAPEYRTILRSYIKKTLGTVTIKDKRGKKRLGLVVHIFTPQGEKIGVTKNLSPLGCLIKLAPDYPSPSLHSDLHIQFTLPNSQKRATIKTKIIRIEEKECGVEFVSISPEDKKCLETVIQGLSTPPLI